jgi:hypothetical protein
MLSLIHKVCIVSYNAGIVHVTEFCDSGGTCIKKIRKEKRLRMWRVLRHSIACVYLNVIEFCDL